MLNIPTEKQLEVLNTWPKGSVGYFEEEYLIKRLLDLCIKYGFGRVPQLANAIEDIWRDPDKIKDYKKIHDERLELIKLAKKELGI